MYSLLLLLTCEPVYIQKYIFYLLYSLFIFWITSIGNWWLHCPCSTSLYITVTPCLSLVGLHWAYINHIYLVWMHLCVSTCWSRVWIFILEWDARLSCFGLRMSHYHSSKCAYKHTLTRTLPHAHAQIPTCTCAQVHTQSHRHTHTHTLTLPQKQTNTNTHFFVTIFNLWGMCDIVYRCQISQTAGNRIIIFFFIYWEVQGRFSHFSSFVIREGRRS